MPKKRSSKFKLQNADKRVVGIVLSILAILIGMYFILNTKSLSLKKDAATTNTPIAVRKQAEIKSPLSGDITFPAEFVLSPTSHKSGTYVTLTITSPRGNLYLSPNLVNSTKIKIDKFTNKNFSEGEKITITLMTKYSDGYTSTNYNYYTVKNHTPNGDLFKQWCAANIAPVKYINGVRKVTDFVIDKKDIDQAIQIANSNCPIVNGKMTACMSYQCNYAYCPGDVNGDYKVNIFDITWLGSHINIQNKVDCP